MTAGEAVIRAASATPPTGLSSSAVVHIHEGYDVTVKGFVFEARNRINSTNVHLVYVEGKDATINSVAVENNIIGPITSDTQDGTKGSMALAFDSQGGGPNGLCQSRSSVVRYRVRKPSAGASRNRPEGDTPV